MSVWQGECEACGNPFERQRVPHTRAAAKDWPERRMILCDPCYHAAYYQRHKAKPAKPKRSRAEKVKAKAAWWERWCAEHREHRLAYMREYSRKRRAERRAA